MSRNGLVVRALWATGLLVAVGGLSFAQDLDDRDALERRLGELDRERAQILRALERRAPAPGRSDEPVESDRPATPDMCQPSVTVGIDPGTALGETIIVVAKRHESDSAEVTAALSRFDRADIDRRQSTHVLDVLREAPGVYVLPDGPRGQFSRVFTRGSASNQTLVLVDGIPQNDSTSGGGFDFNDLTTAGVERVEVVRGSYGVLYGSEAIGGVINVVTRRGHDGPTRAFARAEVGSFGTHAEEFGVAGGDAKSRFSLNLSSFRTDGERDREEFRATDLKGAFDLELSSRAHLATTLRWVDSKVQSPFDFATTGVLPEDDNIDRTRRTLSVGATLSWEATDWLDVRVTGSVLDIDSTFDNQADGDTTVDPDFVPGSGDEFTVVQAELLTESLQTDTRGRIEGDADLGSLFGWRPPQDGGLGLTVVAGGEYLDQASRSVATFPDFNAATSTTTRNDQTTRTESFFTQADVFLPDLGGFTRGVITLGARRDDHSEFGDESSPYLGGRIDVPGVDATLRSSYGEGFRAPKPSELNDGFIGNVALGPETSESFDVGAEVRLLDGDLTLGATWFRLRVEDLVAFDSTATSTSRPFGQLTNLGEVETKGWEGTAAADLGSGFTFRGAVTIQNPRDKGTTLNLQNRAKHFGSAGLSWEKGPVLVSLDGYFSGRNPDQGGATTYPEPSERREPGRTKLVNLTLRYRASETVTLFGRVENLLDDDYVSTPTSPAGSPLGVFVGALFEF